MGTTTVERVTTSCAWIVSHGVSWLVCEGGLKLRRRYKKDGLWESREGGGGLHLMLLRLSFSFDWIDVLTDSDGEEDDDDGDGAGSGSGHTAGTPHDTSSFGPEVGQVASWSIVSAARATTWAENLSKRGQVCICNFRGLKSEVS